MKQKSFKTVWFHALCAISIIALCLSFFTGCYDDTFLEDYAKLEKDLSSSKSELESLQTKYDTALKENEALSNDNETAKNEIDALKAENATAKQEIEALKAENATAKQEINSLKSENESAKKELDELKASNEEALKELEDLQKQFDDLLNYVTPESSEKKIKIYIDQGHNPTSYHNSGSSGNGLYEEDITFTVGRRLAGLLALDERFDVRLSRPTPTTVLGTNNDGSLEARVQGAKDFEADFFISLHVNAYTEASAHGIEVHTAEASGTSYEFGSYLLDGIVDSTNLRNRGMKQSPNLHVLKNATMPAALVEMGFISNPNDAALLDESPELFAQGLYDGILNYFNFS